MTSFLIMVLVYKQFGRTRIGNRSYVLSMGWGLGIAQWHIYKSSLENSNFYFILDNSLEKLVKFWKFNSTVGAKPREKFSLNKPIADV